MVEAGGIGEGGGATAAEVMDGSSTRRCNGRRDGGSVAMVMDSGGSNGTGRTAAQNSSSSVFCVERNISVSVCVSKILTDIFFYVTDIPYSTRTIRGTNLIKWCQRDHLLEGILKGLRVRAAGLKLFMVSIDDLVCQLCIGCSLSLSNNRTKLCVITDIFGTSYSF